MASVTNAVGTASTTNATSYNSGSFTPVAGDLLVVFVVATGTTLASPTLTASANGITFTSTVLTAAKNSSADRLYAFIANQFVPASPSAMTVNFDCTGDAATGAIISVARVAGMSRVGTDAIRQSAKADNVANGTAPATVFGSSALTGNPTLQAVATAVTATTPPSGWTEQVDTTYGTPTTGGGYSSRDSGFTGTTITLGTTSTGTGGSCAVALELDASVPPWSLMVHDTKGTNTAVTSVTSQSFTPQANSKLYVWVWSQQSSDNSYTFATPTDNLGTHLTYTQIAVAPAVYGPFNSYYELWEADVGASPSAMTITMAVSGATNYWPAYVIASVTASAGPVAIVSGQVTTGQQVGGATTWDTGAWPASGTSGNLALIFSGANRDSATAIPAPAGWATNAANAGGGIFESASLFSNQAFTGTQITGTSNGPDNEAYGNVMIELAVTGGGGGTQYAVDGTIVASSGLSGSVVRSVPLSGAVDAVSGLSGAVALLGSLSGTAAATSAAVGNATAIVGVSGTVGATGGVTEAATATHPLAGTAPATSGLSGAVSGRFAVDGTVVAGSDSSGSVAGRFPLSGVAPATSAAVGNATANYLVSGTVVSVSGVTGTVDIPGGFGLTGTVVALSGASGTIAVQRALSGTVAATSGVSGAVAALLGLTGTAAGVSGQAGTANSRQGVSGTVPVSSSVAGTVKALLGLSGSVTVVSGDSGAIGAALAVSGQVEVLSTTSGTVKIAGEGFHVTVIEIAERPRVAVSVSERLSTIVVMERSTHVAVAPRE